MSESNVLLQVDGAIATVQLDNPQRYNALSLQVVEELQGVVQRLAVSEGIRAVVIHGGSSNAFCSGADLKERQGMDERQVFAMVHLLRETVTMVERLPMPVIAAIHGMAFGGGFELALACDIRIIADDAQLGLTETSLGIIPGSGGCARLPLIVGTGKAKELIFTARRLNATEAQAMGLANLVLPREHLLSAAQAMAEQIAANGPLAVRAAKRAINRGLATAEALAAEWEEYQQIIPTQDRLEGLRAFAQKRKPEFRGE